MTASSGITKPQGERVSKRPRPPEPLPKGVEATNRRGEGRDKDQHTRCPCAPDVRLLLPAVRAGLTLDHVSEHTPDADLAARSPRTAKYLAWPVRLLMRQVPGG